MGDYVKSIIRFDNVSLSFGNRKILEKISFEVKKGDTMVILGPSGAGKSSILKVLLGLWKPQSGNVWVYDKDITIMDEFNLNEIRKNIGVVFQGNALFDSMTVGENIAFFLREHNRKSSEEIAKRVSECLSFVNLEGIEDLYPEELSGGMKKRVAIARAIAFKPDILLYDEPTTGIDPINVKSILELIKKIQREGATSIVVTHDVYNAIQVGNMFTVIEEGKLVASGSIKDILKINTSFIKEFFAEILSVKDSELEIFKK
jgi:phospholipid/cholesterol/gamma-HCH transport system ATP-binding protein